MSQVLVQKVDKRPDNVLWREFLRRRGVPITEAFAVSFFKEPLPSEPHETGTEVTGYCLRREWDDDFLPQAKVYTVSVSGHRIVINAVSRDRVSRR